MKHITRASVLTCLGTLLPALLAAQPARDLAAMEPVVCTGSERIEIRGRRIVAPDAAVRVVNVCEVEIVDSQIVSEGTAIRVVNGGRVSIRNSYIAGGRHAVRASNTARVWLRDSVIRGDLRQANRAEIVDEGGNDFGDWEGASPAPATSADDVSVRTGEGGVEIRAGGQEVRVSDGPEGTRVTTSEGQDVSVTRGPGGAVDVAAGGAQVVVDGDYVRIRPAGPQQPVGDAWRERSGSVYADADAEEVLAELDAETRDGQVYLNLAGDILFDFDSASIQPQAAEQLQKVGHVLRQRSAGDIDIVGHTDALGGDAYNDGLSQQRALAVMRWLHEHEGIPLALMRGRGLGSRQPIAHNTRPDGSDDPAGRARNRRVEVRFTTLE